MKLKREEIFGLFYDGSLGELNPNDVGRIQFKNLQSEGKKPENSDLYYRQLMLGKERLDFLVTEYKHMYENGEWWGLYQLWKDWAGKRKVIPYLLRWTNWNLPTEITSENITDEQMLIILKKHKLRAI